ncbi:unnamed protein product [Bursaphelenchus okinawaensis]|uniref:Uncharacterized protein n=1 Tax=Bursaphelenchus okinawaensis TaxID=465554 RepID=A0A811LQ63_9BILA|nr:unnamed protein product [Bursaphelenchus okinawaensis]CAG9126954.1 unnamed protein product [Bursaphelenchus okinawaensis]
MSHKDIKDRTLAALMAILAFLSVAAVLGLANYIYDGWVCAEKTALFNNQPTVSSYQSKSAAEKNYRILHVNDPECCLVIPECSDCQDRQKGTVTTVITSSIDVFELLGEEGFSLCDQLSVGRTTIVTDTLGVTRNKKAKNFVICNENTIVTSVNLPFAQLETYCPQ